MGLKETGQALIVYCHFVIIVLFFTVLVSLGSLNVKHWVSLHKVLPNALIISFLELFQQLFFKFDENLKMVLNQFISVSQEVKNEIDKWIFGFEYATILLKNKEPFLRFIVGFYAHFLYFVWKSIFLNVYRDFSGGGNGT